MIYQTYFSKNPYVISYTKKLQQTSPNTIPLTPRGTKLSVATQRSLFICFFESYVADIYHHYTTHEKKRCERIKNGELERDKESFVAEMHGSKSYMPLSLRI